MNPLRVLIGCEFSGTVRDAFLRRLLPLVETNPLKEPDKGSPEWKAWNRVHRMPPGQERAMERSRFYSGIADAMADQWGGWAMREELAA